MATDRERGKHKSDKQMLLDEIHAMLRRGSWSPGDDTQHVSAPLDDAALSRVEALPTDLQLQTLAQLTVPEVLALARASSTLRLAIDSNAVTIMSAMLRRIYSSAGPDVLNAVVARLRSLPTTQAWQVVDRLVSMRPRDGVQVRSVFEEEVFSNLLWASFPEAMGRLFHSAYPAFDLQEAVEYARNLRSWYTRSDGTVRHTALLRAVETVLPILSQAKEDASVARVAFTYPGLRDTSRFVATVTLSALLARGGHVRSLAAYLHSLPSGRRELNGDIRLAIGTLPPNKVAALVGNLVESWQRRGNALKLIMIANRVLRVDVPSARRLIDHFRLNILDVLTIFSRKEVREYVKQEFTATPV